MGKYTGAKQLGPNRKLLVMADKGRNGTFEEIVMQLQCKIPKTGKRLEPLKASNSEP